MKKFKEVESYIFDFVFNNTKEGICIFDSCGRIKFSNQFFERRFKKIENILEIFDTKFKSEISSKLSVLQRNESFDNIYILNGSMYYVYFYRLNKDYLSKFIDFSGNKKLIIEQSMLRFVSDKNPSIIFIFDKEGNIEYVNEAFYNYFGKQNDISGKNIFDIFKEHLSLENIREIKYFVENPSLEWKKKIFFNFEKELLFFLSTIFKLEVKEFDLKRYVMIMEDLGVQEKLASEITKISKFDSLRVITDGISHDLNNVLAALIGNISLAKCYIEKDHPVYEFLEESEKACSRAKDLSLKLLTISKGQPLLKKKIKLNDLLKDVTIFVINGKFDSKKIKVEFVFEEDNVIVDADEGQLVQVIDNIVTNACQAMPEGGRLVVGIRFVELTEDKNYLPIKSGKYVCIYFEDSGKGISPHIISKIFDPYFTTKPGGSGLGLTISYSIIRNHKGYIDVISRIGVGTTFFVYLPV